MRRAKAMPAPCAHAASYYAIFCVGASGVPASVLNIVGNQALYTDPMPLTIIIIVSAQQLAHVLS